MEDRKTSSRIVQAWTPQEEKELRKRHPNTSNADLALHFRRTVGCVKKKASRMGLKKSAQYRQKCLGHKLT
jgi:hypothetical protein